MSAIEKRHFLAFLGCTAAITAVIFVFFAAKKSHTPSVQMPVHVQTTSNQPSTRPAQRNYWVPRQKARWQWQLTTPVDTSVDASVFDIDIDNDASVVAALHTKGKKVICYMETGFWENYRDDSNTFPASVLGKNLDPPFEDERYVDISQVATVLPIMQKRLDACKQKGFDAVEPDGDALLFDAGGSTEHAANIGNGHSITYQQLLAYDKLIAEEAHSRGLSIGLKNGSVAESDQFATDMQPFTDWALEEECGTYNRCAALKPFVKNNKAVFATEYSDNSTLQKCNQAARLNPTFSFIFKDRELSATRKPCQ